MEYRGGDRGPRGGYGGGADDDTSWYTRRRYPAHDSDWDDERRPPPRRDGDRRGRGGRGPPTGRRSAGVRLSPPPPGTIRLRDRVVPSSQWDVPAPGFEVLDALAAKSTGLFGAPVNAGAAGMMMMGVRDAMPSTLPPSALPDANPTTAAAVSNAFVQVHARRLHVTGVRSPMTSESLQAFINAKMNERLLCSSGSMEPCFHVRVQDDKGTATLEFRNPDEATNALSLDGVYFVGYPLSIQRPRDYVGPDIVPPPGAVETTVPDGPNKLFIGNVPIFLDEGQVMELLKAFGEVRHFDLIRDEETQRSRGMAYCEFVEEAVTDMACEGLDGLEVGEQRLVVRRVMAPSNAPPADDVQETSDNPTRAMLMLNMVTAEELMDDSEYADIMEDVRSECERHGIVTSVYIPRPLRDGMPGQEPKGVGRVYVQFDTVPACEAAFKAIAGRQFDGRTVICAYVREDAWPEQPVLES